MWIIFGIFLLAFAYKLFKRHPVFVYRTYENIYAHSSLLLSAFIFTFLLVYIRVNVKEQKWEWYKYISHAVISTVCLTATAFYTRPTMSLSSMMLIATGFAFGHVADASVLPWVNVTTLFMMLGSVQEKMDVSIVALSVITCYAFFLFAQVPMDWSGIIVLTAFVKSITLIVADNAVQEIPWSMLLAAYNVAQLLNIPNTVEDEMENADLLIITGVGLLLFMLQWTIIIWISHIGSTSYILGMLLIDMLFVLSNDITTEALYFGWFCVFILVGAYSNFPWNRNQLPREPSVPPLPDDEVPPQPPASLKKKRENSIPSAPLDLPDPPTGVPTQDDIV